MIKEENKGLEYIPYSFHTMVKIIGMDKFFEVSKMYGLSK